MGFIDLKPEHFEQNDFMFEQFTPFYDEIWLFGTGDYAVAFDKYLNYFGVKAEGFVVSDLSKYCAVADKPVIDIGDFKAKYTGESKVALLLTVNEKYYDEIVPSLDFCRKDILFLSEEAKKCATYRFPVADTVLLNFTIVAHCNLNCFGCVAVSPITTKWLYDVKQFEHDIRKLHDLLGASRVRQVHISGGEILLHPQLAGFFRITREVFPNCILQCETNGLSFSEQDDSFWDALGKYKVLLMQTVYPIKYSFSVDNVLQKSEQYGFEYIHGGDSYGSNPMNKTSWRFPFDLRGKQSPYDFLYCIYHRCNVSGIYIKDNLVFSCPPARGINCLQNYFGYAPPLKDSDYLKLDEIQNVNELDAFLARRLPLCDYCAIRKRESLGKWLPSKKEKCEWFVTDEED